MLKRLHLVALSLALTVLNPFLFASTLRVIWWWCLQDSYGAGPSLLAWIGFCLLAEVGVIYPLVLSRPAATTSFHPQQEINLMIERQVGLCVMLVLTLGALRLTMLLGGWA